MRLLISALALGLFRIGADVGSGFQVQTLAGSDSVGDGGPAAAAVLRQVEGLAIRSDGAIYLADAGGHRIRFISPGGVISTIAGDGTPGFTGDGGSAVKARVHSPYGLALDRNGNLFVADLGNARVRLISRDGKIRTVAGGGDIPQSGAEGTSAQSVRLIAPRNVLADPDGGVYVSDFDAHRVVYVSASGVLTTFAGTGAAGFGADNIAANRSALRHPAGLAFDTLGGVVIADSGANRLRRVARGMVGPFLAEFVRLNPLYSPTGIAIDAAGSVYIADSRGLGSIKRSPHGEAIALPVAGRAVAIHPFGGALYAHNAHVLGVDASSKAYPLAGGTQLGEFTTAASLRLAAPSGLCFDRDGNLFVSDEGTHRVYKITAGGAVSIVAGTGSAGFAGDQGPPIRALLNAPRGLTLDGYGNLYIADSGNHAIRRVSPFGFITTIAGNGFKGSRGDGGPATAAQLDSPSDVKFGPSGDMFVADSGNNRVRRIAPDGTVYTFTSSLNDPRGLAVNAMGEVFIADTGANRILRGAVPFGEPAFASPRGLAIAGDGSVVVADTGRHRILRLNGGTISPLAGSEPGFAGDGLTIADARFQFPSAITTGPDGAILIADTGNYRIRRLTPTQIGSELRNPPIRILHAATGLPAPIVPGLLADLVGENLAPAGNLELIPVNGRFPLSANGVTVSVNGEQAELVLLTPARLRVRFPRQMAPALTAVVEVAQGGVVRVSAVGAFSEAAPAIFPVAVLADGRAASASEPASRGTIVTLFGSGEGALDPTAARFTVGGLEAQTVWGGTVAWYPGLFQVNLRLPAGFFPAGQQALSGQINGFQIAGGFDLPVH